MTEGKDYYLIQNKDKLYMLLGGSDRYHIISVDKHLTENVEERLLRIYPCSDDILREMNLVFTVIDKRSIRGIAVGGCEAGDMLVFHIGKEKRKYVLSDDYSPEQLEEFFCGIPRFQVPKKKKSKSEDAWRKERRDKVLYKKFKYVTPVLVILNLLCSLCYVITGAWAWLLGMLVCTLIPAVLDIVFPAYFTLILPEKGKRSEAWELSWVLYPSMFFLILMRMKNWLNEFMFFVVLVICGLASVIIMGLFAEEFRRKKSNLLAVFFIGGIFGCLFAGHFNEIPDFTQPQTYVLEVEDMDKRTGKNQSYECTVTLPDGREVDLEISGSFYNKLEIGDLVRVEHGIGALGIEYANAYPLDQTLPE